MPQIDIPKSSHNQRAAEIRDNGRPQGQIILTAPPNLFCDTGTAEGPDN